MQAVWSALRVLLSATGVVFGVLVLILSLVSIQGMSGGEPFARVLILFCLSFAVAFGIGAMGVAALRQTDGLRSTALAFGAGGAAGGALLAVTLKIVTDFDAHLRTLTGGGPIGMFLLAGFVGALVIPVVIGTVLLKRTR